MPVCDSQAGQNGNQKSRGIVSTPCHADVVGGGFPSALYQRLVKSTVVSSERNMSNRKQIKVTD
ncbi:hypothetical protein N7463_009198 [Penicillium fimorum]|uniref:Uncharacterized protein n=1 Tax=Penicillium fimorum TaxID=1882269 RepID=A0A9W9XQB3_9EURO|nr:hypothetical protein N7463_009198 [Penicillium fimorum]